MGERDQHFGINQSLGPMNVERTSFPVVQGLRGVAALLVCWFHLTNSALFAQGSIVRLSGSIGWVGVDVFFVISGFIVPYVMLAANYRIDCLPRFMAKRIIRVDPPYIISIVIILLLNFTASQLGMFRGAKPRFDVLQLSLHLGYLIPFFKGATWLNIAYWTLAVEFQYYLGLAVLFPLLFSKGVYLRFVSVVGLLAASAISQEFVFPYIPLFLLGIYGVWVKSSALRRWELFLYLFMIVWMASRNVGWVAMLAGLVTISAILGLKYRPRALLHLGDISYSLYLLHVPIGGKVMNLALRFATTAVEKALWLAFALFLSIAAAYCLYLIGERPAKRLASRIRYRHPGAGQMRIVAPAEVRMSELRNDAV